MIESAALDIIAVRAIESTDRERAVWSDSDRAWASHAAAQGVGESAPAESYLARRAQFALERLQQRHRSLPRVVASMRWRPWVGVALVLGAFVFALLVDRVGDAQRINVLAPPMLLLVLWNLAVYAVIAGAKIVRPRAAPGSGAVRKALVHLASGGHGARSVADAPLASAFSRLAADWALLAAPLYGARAARVLHLAAAALGLGLIAGLYVRGIAFEYRATWESTFLDPAMVRALLAVLLAPGAWVGGLVVPDVAQVRAIRAPGGENAAQWLHLMALTLLVLVVLPRLALAAMSGVLERQRARHFDLSLSEPYFHRLLRAFHVAPAQVQVFAYGFTPAAVSIDGLQAVLERLLGADARVRMTSAIAYGDDGDAELAGLASAPGPVVALLNLAATPESEAHCAFVAALARRVGASQPLLVVLDEAAFRARAGVDPNRLEQRRSLWRESLESTGVTLVFVDLGAPDLCAADAAFEAALYRERH